MPDSLRRSVLVAIILLLTSVGFLASCSQKTETTPTPAAIVPPVSETHGAVHGREAVVGVVLSLTGSAAIYGEPQRKGIGLALDQLNDGAPGHPHLILDIRDDAGDAQKAKAAYEELVAREGLLAIVGPTLSSSAVVADPVAQSAGVPVLAVSNTAAGVVEIGDYIYRNSLSEAQVIPQTIAAAKAKLGLTRVAIIYGADETFTVSGYNSFKSALTANGIEVTTEQSYAPGTTDFSDQLRNIASTHPDAIVASALAKDAATIMQQARQLGVTAQFIGGNGFNSRAVLLAAGDAAEGLIVGAAWNISASSAVNQKFVADYRAKYNEDPDQFAAQAYAGMYILTDSIAKIGLEGGRADLRDSLKTSSLETVLGPFRFLPTRDAQHEAVVQVVRGGKFAVLE